MKKSFILFACIVCASASFAKISLPSIISNNMVLQQNDSVELWGWASVSEKIFITTSWNNYTASTIATSSANWQLKIKTPAAGGPYSIKFKGDNTIVLNNVLIGEVWVCSGQSNMQMSYSWGIPQMKPELDSCYNTNIRFFQVPVTSAQYPQDNCRGEWTICDSNTLKTFSAAGYYFGKQLNKYLNVPVGLINSSWGATSAEVWTPDAVVNNDSVIKKDAATLQPNQWCPVQPGIVYNGMIAPIINYKIKGVIWYQGEGNTGNPLAYSKVFTTMIEAWRNAWNEPLPFYYVQIAPYNYGDKQVGALLQEQQAKAMQYDNVGMVVTTDLVTDTNNIHPKNKKDVGIRLANWALAKTYNKNRIAYASPSYKNMEIKNGKAIISFNNADNGLTSNNEKINELYVAGADKTFYPADAKIEKNNLIVWSKQVKQPVAVRYAFGNTSAGNLFSTNGLPVVPFRTDDWKTE